MRHLLPCPPCGRQGRPGQGFLAGFIERPRGSAPRERDHRGGDHPVPSRTRQLSPPSPRVLQREAAGGQGVALAEGAFLYAHGAASPRRKRGRRAGRGPQGGCCPCGPLLRHGLPAPVSGIFGGCAFPFGRHRGGDAACAPKSRGGSSSAALFESRGGKIDLMVLAAQRRRRARSGNLPPCEPFLRYEVERCLPDASLVLIQNEFAVSTVGYVGGFGCYLIVYET